MPGHPERPADERRGAAAVSRAAAGAAAGLHTALVEETLASLTKARSMLILLLATCNQTQVTLEAAANALDTDLTDDLTAMIARTEHELGVLTEKIKALPG
jgi:hypothetical protein